MTYLILLLLVGALWLLLWRYKQRRGFPEDSVGEIEWFFLETWMTTGLSVGPRLPFIKVFHVRWYTSINGPRTHPNTIKAPTMPAAKRSSWESDLMDTVTPGEVS